MSKPSVTIVVSPRDRFSSARRSLESLYRNAHYPFDLVYVDGNSPPRVRRFLEAESVRQHFRLIREDRYLSPNQARNIGLREVATEYVAFVDNDVEVSAGWLAHLVACAEETGASAVSPLVFEGTLENQVIHLFGGHLKFTDERGARGFHEVHLFNGQTVDEVASEIRRMPTDFFEFHCVLVRRDVLDTVGPCDERLLSLQEHLDLSLLIRQAGGTVYVEPRSRVGFPSDGLLDRHDIAYARLRWSADWNRRSTQHFAEKWNIDPAAVWVAASINWGNGYGEHLERMRYRPMSLAKLVARRVLSRRAYAALRDLRPAT